MAKNFQIRHINPDDISVSEESFKGLFEHRIEDIKRQNYGFLPTSLIGEWPELLEGAICKLQSNENRSSNLAFLFRKFRKTNSFEPLTVGTADITIKFKSQGKWNKTKEQFLPPVVEMICQNSEIDLDKLTENLKDEMMASRLAH